MAVALVGIGLMGKPGVLDGENGIVLLRQVGLFGDDVCNVRVVVK